MMPARTGGVRGSRLRAQLSATFSASRAYPASITLSFCITSRSSHSLRGLPSRLVIAVRSKSSKIWGGSELAPLPTRPRKAAAVILPVVPPFGEKLRDHRRFDNNTPGIGKVVRHLDPLAHADKSRVIAPPRPQRAETTLLVTTESGCVPRKARYALIVISQRSSDRPRAQPPEPRPCKSKDAIPASRTSATCRGRPVGQSRRRQASRSDGVRVGRARSLLTLCPRIWEVSAGSK